MSEAIIGASFNVKHSSHAMVTADAVERLYRLTRYDFICLQEISWKIVPGAWRTLGRELSRTLRMRWAYEPHPRLYFCWIEGVLVLSRFPIIRRQRIRLSRGRVACAVTVAAPGPFGALQIVSVHLSGSSAELRELEIKRLITVINPRRAIIAGDLNEHPFSPRLRLFEDDFVIDADPSPTGGFDSNPRKLDYFICSRDMEIDQAVTIDLGTSDHRARTASIRLAEPQEQRPG